MTLSVKYRFNGGSEQTLPNWPALDSNGASAQICTDPGTPLGTYAFTAMQNSQNAGYEWIPVATAIEVVP